MPKIKILPSYEAQKIAAGQVIERPAHVIKELVENALDANATRISIYVEDGGKQRMRVVITVKAWIVTMHAYALHGMQQARFAPSMSFHHSLRTDFVAKLLHASPRQEK
jgi:hypothetical protein